MSIRKATILNGAGEGDPVIARLERGLTDLLHASAWDVESIPLCEKKIAPCMGDFGCWEKTPGVCVLKDDAIEVARDVINSGLVVLVTPVTFGGYSSHLKKALDRMICLMSPLLTRIGREFHHKKRYGRYPALIGLGVLKKPDRESERIFKTLVTRNAVNLHAPRSAAATVVCGADEGKMTLEIRALLSAAGITP